MTYQGRQGPGEQLFPLFVHTPPAAATPYAAATDGELVFELTNHDGSSNAVVNFPYFDAANRLVWRVSGTGNDDFIVQPRVNNTLGTSTNNNDAVPYGTSRINIVKRGNEYRGYVNGELKLSYTDVDNTFTAGSTVHIETMGAITKLAFTQFVEGEAPAEPEVRHFLAADGVITAPFTVDAEGAVSQPSNVKDPALGGKAEYTVMLNEPRDVQLRMLVDAPHTGANSFYVNINGPNSEAAPSTIWDTPLTVGFDAFLVAQRGNGTVDAPEFTVAKYSLPAGESTLIVQGREGGTRLKEIWVEDYVPPEEEPPYTPATLELTNPEALSSTSVRFGITGHGGDAASIEVQRATSSSFSTVATSTTNATATSFTAEELVASTTYYFRAREVMPDATTGDWSNVVSVQTLAEDTTTDQWGNSPSDFSNTPPAPGGRVWFVSRNGNNGDATSWATAKTDFPNIPWSSVKPGDVIRVDGGSSSMSYPSMLTFGASGTADKWITIEVASDSGRNGQVIIDGGASGSFENCLSSRTNGRANGLNTNGKSHIFLKGKRWRHWVIRKHKNTGVIASGGSHCRLRGLWIYDNGNTNSPRSEDGCNWSGSHHTFEYTINENNTADSWQIGGNCDNIKWWRSIARTTWICGGSEFNRDSHQDGIQHHNSTAKNMVIEECVFDQGLLQGVIYGDNTNTDGYVVRNSLFDLTGTASTPNAVFLVKNNGTVKNGRFERVTFIQKSGANHNVRLRQNTLRCKDSIFVNSQLYSSDGGSFIDDGGNMRHNCANKTNLSSFGTVADPQFEGGSFYKRRPRNSSCWQGGVVSNDRTKQTKGSSIWSVAHLLSSFPE